jgi:pimeloyl-ACP methyl ester carboxylesterase
MWLPDSFRDRVRGGIYFLERRDPTRIPVLFIHGINGSPRDFNLLIFGLDRRRYQPCAYFYPSGARLRLIAEDLARELRILRSGDGIDRVILIAHSMGGLIARDVLVNDSLDGLEVPILITISTPWNGHAGAAFGARFAPLVVPAWLDLAQGSAYLEALFADRSGRPRRWPDAVCHHLIFTYGRRWTSLGVSGDEVVTVASQLSRPAQAQAARIYGFNTTHAQILSDAALGQLVSAILSDYRVDSRARGE